MVHVFIVNPDAGKGGFAAEIHKIVSERKDIESYFTYTRRGLSEEALVNQMLDVFEGEKIRFYSCGGQGTLRRVVNGFKDLSNVSIAFCPYGLTNDYLSAFGDKEDLFRNVNNLIDGDICEVDYIKTNHGIALNTLSTGVDTIVVQGVNDYISFSAVSPKIPYGIAYASVITKCRPVDYIITTDDGTFEIASSEIIMGNGGRFGGDLYFSENFSVVDGIGELIICPAVRGLGVLPFLNCMKAKNYEKLSHIVKSYKSTKYSIKRKDGRPIQFNLDGDMVNNYDSWDIEMVHKGLKLIVPKGVSLQ